MSGNSGNNFWGNLIRSLREEQQISQRTLASAAKVNRSTLRRIEAGQTSGDIRIIERLLNRLGYELEGARGSQCRPDTPDARRSRRQPGTAGPLADEPRSVVGSVAAETKDELADALKRIEELEGLIAEYILREAIMQIEIKALYDSGAQIFPCN